MARPLLCLWTIPAFLLLILGLRAQTTRQLFSLTMAECEDTAGCSTWSFHDGHAQGRWNNGSIADLAIEKFDANLIVIRRRDDAGTVAGLRAIYSGHVHGDRLS